MEKMLPAIPAKRYFTIGEVSELCGVKPYVLRYWEQEFTQLKPMKRRGNRRYYQHHEVLLIRRIRELLYDQGFTISGARNRLADAEPLRGSAPRAWPEDPGPDPPEGPGPQTVSTASAFAMVPAPAQAAEHPTQGAKARAATAGEASPGAEFPDVLGLRAELLSIRELLKV